MGFKIYKVGGAVRDQLLGLPIKDKDYVVVGATPKELKALGYRLVGKNFPVFLHPKSKCEYALARTERKVAKGYRGFKAYFSPTVSLEEDLNRRDFTINAIAKARNGRYVDPIGGMQDVLRKVIRHVSPAFVEDPVRILRAARFSAKLTEFTIAPDTMQLMKQMVEDGEVDALVPERVWQELAKGLMEAKPSRMFEVLRACGALKKILPELDRLWGVPQPAQHHPEIDTGVHVMMVIDYAASQNYSLPVRFAALTHDLGKGTTPADMLPRHIGHEDRSVNLLKDMVKRLRVPNDCKELAQIVAKYHGKVHRVDEMRPGTILQFLHDTDAIRQPARFKEFLQACESDSRGRTGFENKPFPQADRLLKILDAVLAVDAGAVAKQFNEPEKIRQAVFDARVEVVKASLG